MSKTDPDKNPGAWEKCVIPASYKSLFLMG